MVNISKHIAYWRDGAKEDWDVAVKLVHDGKTRHGLFFAHLAIEKALKALVCRSTGDLAPRLHNLVKLAESAGLTLTPEQNSILADLNTVQAESRYPELQKAPPSRTGAEEIIARAGEAYLWLTATL